jgi:hypothetical protein
VTSRLSAVDLTNLAVEAPDTPMHVGVLAVLDGTALCDAGGRLRLDVLRTRIDDLLDAVPELRCVVYRPGPLAGPPLWIDDPGFRIDRHVSQIELPPPGDEATLFRLTENLLAPLLDRDHPMWRIWFVTGLPDGRVAALIALHHAIADGPAALQLLAALTGPAETATAPPRHHAAAPRWAELARDNAQVRLAAIGRLARARHPHR